MFSPPTIFVSAVSQELKSARQLVANTLQYLGYRVMWQEILGAEQGDICEILRRKIDDCDGVVQLVGKCYGGEPKEDGTEFGRVSFTQYEAIYARTRGKKVWYLVVDDPFTGDPHEPEGEEFSERQLSYRRGLPTNSHLFHTITTTDGIQAKILMLRDQFAILRRPARVLAGVVLTLLTLLVIGIVTLGIGLRSTQAHLQNLEQLKAQNPNGFEAIHEFAQTYTRSAASGPKEDEPQRTSQTYAELEEKLKVPKGSLQRELPRLANQLLATPGASPLDKANAHFVKGEYAEAEKAALQAREKAVADGAPAGDAVNALVLAGQCAEAQVRYGRALEQYRAAAALTNEDDSPAEWAHVQFNIAYVLLKNGEYDEAVTTWRKVGGILQKQFGPDNEDTLTSRMGLAAALNAAGNYVDAANEYRAALDIQEHILGPDHPDTLRSKMGLANALYYEHDYAGAEPEYRAVLAMQERVLGAESPDILSSRVNLANLLMAQHQYAEAGKEYRAVLGAQKRLLGPQHPDTLGTWNNLATALDFEGDHSGAENELRAVLKAREQVLGSEHPDTLSTRANLANALAHAGQAGEEAKSAEAEKEYRALLPMQERVLGPEHPSTLRTRNGLAVVLEKLGNYSAAEKEYQAIVAIHERVSGAEHPETLAAVNALAWSLVEQGKFQEAEAHLQPALETMKRVLTNDSEIILNSLDTLGEALREQKRFKEAEAQHRDALARGEHAKAPNALLLFQSCYHLALTLEAEGVYEEALALARRAEDGYHKTAGADVKTTRDATDLRQRLETEVKKS